MGFFGHIGLGLVIKRFTPQIPLWVLLISSTLIDIPAIIFMGLIPLWLTHGLFMAIIWTLLSILGSFLIFIYLNSKKKQYNNKKSTKTILFMSMVIGMVVFSHWVIDLIGWSMTGNGIPILFNDSQLFMINIQINIIIGLLIFEFGPFIIGLVIYIHYFRKIKEEKNSKINTQ